MTTTPYFLSQELPTESYRRLIAELVDNEDWFGLAWRDGLTFAPAARSVWNTLKPLQIDHRRTDRWPGTRLASAQATVIKYRTSRLARRFLDTAGGLFAWRSPERPEDLFFGSDRTGLALVTVAHEREAWLLRRRYAAVIGQTVTLVKENLDRRDLDLIEGR